MSVSRDCFSSVNAKRITARRHSGLTSEMDFAARGRTALPMIIDCGNGLLENPCFPRLQMM